MKFLHISDTHSLHAQLDLPEADCLIVSGDFTNIGSIEDIVKFNSWLQSLPHKYKVVVAGNHDSLFETNNSLARTLLSSAIYLQDEEVTIEGIRIYGSPWQIEFCNWAFNLPKGKKLKEKWDMIPKGIDILVTHCPPYGIGDSVSKNYPSSRPLGCEELKKAVKRTKPRFHLFGHIHDGNGVYRNPMLNKTTFINSAICNEKYKPVQPYHIFEMSKKDE